MIILQTNQIKPFVYHVKVEKKQQAIHLKRTKNIYMYI